MAKIVLARALRSDLTAACEPDLTVGDAVYVAGQDASGAVLFGRADPSVREKMPALGIVSEKVSETLCVAAFLGEVTGLTGLLPNASYFVGQDGRISPSRPRGTPSSPVFVQRVGEALSPTSLYLRGLSDMIKVVS